MWIENLLNQINIGNLSQVGLKQDNLNQGCFLELINSILGSKDLIIAENHKEVEDAKSFDQNVGTNNLIGIFNILSGLLSLDQELKNSINYEQKSENSNIFFKKSKIFEELPEQKKYDLYSKLQDLLSQHPEIVTIINNNFLTKEKIVVDEYLINKENLEVEKVKDDKSLLKVISSDKKINPENLTNILNKDLPKQVVNFNKDLNFNEVNQNPIIQGEANKIDQKFLKNKSNSEQIFDHYIEGNRDFSLSNNKINLNFNTEHNDNGDLNINNTVNVIRDIELKEGDYDKNDLNKSNNFDSIGKYAYENVEKIENNDTVIFKNKMEIKNNEDVKNMFKEQILIKKNNDHSITLIMEPKEIGKVKVSLTINDSVIKAEVYPNTEMARNFFKENMDKIISSLGSEGINLGQFTLKDDRGNRSNDKEIENDKKLHTADSVVELKQEVKRSDNLTGLSVYA